MDEDQHKNAAAAAAAAVGLRFKPSDPLLIAYLYNKISKKIDMGDMIKEHDLYGQEEPWEIWERFDGHKVPPGEHLYFFTKLKKETSNGSRISRSVGSGTWKGEDKGTPITHPSYSQIGYKKIFRYEDGVAEKVGQWIIHEFSLDEKLINNDDPSYVLCKLRKNERVMT